MEKHEILDIALNLYEEAYSVNEYWYLIKQQSMLVDTYNSEMNSSTAFFHIVNSALVEALFIKLAKLYEGGEKAFSIYFLHKVCMENITLFPENRGVEQYEVNGAQYTHTICFSRHIKEDEKRFFQRETELSEFLAGMLGMENEGVYVEFPDLKAYLEFYRKKYSSINVFRENLRKQRNDIYAHNSKNVNFQYDLLRKKYPVDCDTIESLIDFALDFTVFCITLLSDVTKPRLPIDIDDLENLLQLARIGMEYEDQYYHEREVRGML